MAYLMKRNTKKQLDEVAPASTEPPKDALEASWDDIAAVDVLSLEVGFRLVPLVDVRQNGELINKIKGLRKKFAQTVGFLTPSVHISDNLELKPAGYAIKILV